MGQLVADQLASGRRLGLILTRREVEVDALGESPRTDPGGLRTGVAPVWWTPRPFPIGEKRSPRCRRPVLHTLRSSAVAWWSWSDRAVGRRSWPGSLSRPPNRSATGCARVVSRRDRRQRRHRAPSGKNCSVCVERIVNCAKSERFWQKPQPGLLGRPIRYHRGLRIREGKSGCLRSDHDVPPAGCFPQRIPRVVTSSALSTSAGR